MSDEDTLKNIFSLKPGKPYLITRESTNLEFKKSFNKASLADYAKDFAAFANNSGGYIIFGIEDKPHIPIGLQSSNFDDTDEAIITEFINQHFSPAIDWQKYSYDWGGKTFGIIRIHESERKPIMSISEGGKKQQIKSCEIYYRYIARSEKIKYAELAQIIENRIRRENERWQDLFRRIGRIGTENALILDTVEGQIEGGKRPILIDKKLVETIKFIKEGQFTEKEGAIALKLVGDVQTAGVIGYKEKIVPIDPYIHRACDVAELVSEGIKKTFNSHTHVKCWKYYKARKSPREGKAGCNPDFCDYKEKLNYFMYSQKWVDFLIDELSNPDTYEEIRNRPINSF